MAYRAHLMLCGGTGCIASGTLKIKDALEVELKKLNLLDEIIVVMTGCNGFCAEGPVMAVQPDGIFYQGLTEKEIPKLVEEHFLKGRPYQKLMHKPNGDLPIPKMSDIPFFGKQRLIVLKNRGLIDPEKIDDYIARDGYKGLEKALFKMTPEEIIEEVKKSGLRGRGGGGFPTGVKWETCKKAEGEIKYIICNADEGDPGAFMDRSVLESDPHSIVEGMIIGAYAISDGGSVPAIGYVYVRNEYPLAIKNLTIALQQAREYGLVGKDILGSGFNFNIKITRGGGAFVAGESSALMASLEGKVAEPRAKYIHTVEVGAWGMPSCLNNVETWANVPVIIERGANWFTSIGTGDVSKNPWGGSKGTKIFSLVGKVNNTGLVEVPMGIKLREIIYDIGGGIQNNKKFKGVQTGGPSGGVLPEGLLDIPVDFDELAKVGSMMGSGGMIVMDENNCMVDVAKYFLNFLKEESCGKCVPCREGIERMHEILDNITKGKGKESDIELLQEMSSAIIDTALCALGSSAPNPVLTTVKYFRDEYDAHIKDKKCPAGICKELIQYLIDKEKCNGCGACVKQCPTDAISGERKQPHSIDIKNCIKCGACFEVCNFEAVQIN